MNVFGTDGRVMRVELQQLPSGMWRACAFIGAVLLAQHDSRSALGAQMAVRTLARARELERRGGP